MNPDQEKAYTAEFIRRRGPERVARETGLNRQTVRQVANGRNGAGRKVIAALTATYPDYDLKGVLLGKEVARQPLLALSPETEPVPTDGFSLELAQEVARLRAELDRVKLENQYLRAERDEAKEQRAQFWQMLQSLHERNMDFSGVSSQTTDLFSTPAQRLIIEGFGRTTKGGAQAHDWSLPWDLDFQSVVFE